MRYREFVTELVRANPDGSISRGPEQSSTGLQAGPPYPPEQSETVKNLQRKLEELGYSVGNTGIDGKYGPRTSRAVNAYKRDNNVQNTDNGRSISAQELEAMQSAERVESPTPTGNESPRSSAGRSFNPEELEALDFGGADNERAKEIAENFLGSSISDSEWNMLIRATAAEASPNQEERAAVMGVILNRVRDNHGGYGRSISAQLSAPNQFQAVTGTRHDRRPSSTYSNPGRQTVAGVVQAVIDHLESANTSWMNFTSNNPRAYGPGTNPAFRNQVARSQGAQVIGGTVFGTV